MLLIKGNRYWGKKGDSYRRRLWGLLPSGPKRKIVETCMGSGTISANLWFRETEVRRAFEIDGGVYTLNRVIQSEPEKLTEDIAKLGYSRKEYDQAVKILSGKGGKSTDLEIALAEWVQIHYSFNGMRKSFNRLECHDTEGSPIERREKKAKLEEKKKGVFRQAMSIIPSLSKAWEGLEIINESFMDHSDVWNEGGECLIFCDPPYLFSKRGVKKAGHQYTGYLEDWDDKKQIEFLIFVQDVVGRGNVSNILICSDFAVEEDGGLTGFMDDPYVRALAPLGFRMAVVQQKYSSEIHCSKSKRKHRTRKVEVVFMNYEDIIGRPADYQIFDLNESLKRPDKGVTIRWE